MPAELCNILALAPGEFSEAALIIISLIILEGLLSFDNALAIAAMASHLPVHQQKLALRLGILGAYLFRGIVLFFAAWIMGNEWVKWIGAAYLVYLAAKHLSFDGKTEEETHKLKKRTTLIGTVVSIELMDLGLSIDNVIVAIATVNKSTHIPQEHHIWVVCIGVFIGILALRLVAGWSLGIIKKFPILAKTAFLLVGFVAFFFMTEMTLELLGIHLPGHMFIKFGGIFGILFLSLFYEKNITFQKILAPFVWFFSRLNHYVALILEFPFRPLIALFHYFVHKKEEPHS